MRPRRSSRGRRPTDLGPAVALARELLEPRIAELGRSRAAGAGARADAAQRGLDGALRALEPHELLEALRAGTQRRSLDGRAAALAAHGAAVGDGHEIGRGSRGAVVELDPAVLVRSARAHREHGLLGRIAPRHDARDEVAGAERRAVLLGRARRRAHDALRLWSAQRLGRHRLRPRLARLEPPLAQLARLVERGRDARRGSGALGVAVGMGARHALLPGVADLLGARRSVQPEQPLRPRDLNTGGRSTRHALRVPPLRVRASARTSPAP